MSTIPQAKVRAIALRQVRALLPASSRTLQAVDAGLAQCRQFQQLRGSSPGFVSNPPPQQQQRVRPAQQRVPSRFLATEAASSSSASTSSASNSLCDGLGTGAARRFIFVGGKGGVGKTTTAASIAVRLAKSGLKTLVVSTDPAHSLGDALGMQLSGKPTAVSLEDIGCKSGNLFAMEIDPSKVIEDFRQLLHVDRLREALSEKKGGLGAGLMNALAQAGVDLEALASLMELSPPGIDEAVALGQIMQLLESGTENSNFQRVVIDTAPTGHTLRLLSFPQFLHGVIGTILSINEKVSSYSSIGGYSPFGGLFGSIVGDDLRSQLQVTKANLESMMSAMGSLSAVFADAAQTNFVVVTIPTHLAVAESRRLLKALAEAKMPARHLVINQCPAGTEADIDIAAAHAAAAKLASEVGSSSKLGISGGEALLRAMTQLLQQHKQASRQVEILKSEAGPTGLEIFQVPVFDEELIGPAALDRYAGKLRRS